MRHFLTTLMLALLPAAIAAGQVLDNAKPAAGDEPAAQPGEEEGGPGPRMFGRPPNVMFSAIDADGDGIITTRELRRAAVQLKKLDADKDGNISLAEVSPGGAPGGPGGPGGDPVQFVDSLMQNDKNGDAKLSGNEIPNHMRPMLNGADQNGDDALDRAELTAAMENMRNRFPGGPGEWGPGRFRGPGGINQAFDPSQMTGQLMQNDRNGDGRLTSDELPPAALGMLQGSDQNNDGAIDARELQAFSRRMGDRARAFGPAAGNQRNGPGAPARNGRGRERPRNEN
jgi:Ca2+-binding EF-hand superfamily protein